ncbi:MAG TPA: hypothetical protein VHM90_01025, partial [Phycisphaerae bacterium]|nr:hypothetical protein [Phycisphaerae bacterium]
GYTFIHSGLTTSDGWNDIAAGLKWNFVQDYKTQLYASAGAGYQFPWGESAVLQNKEDVRLWLSVNKGFGPLHLGATVNYLKDMGAQGPFGAASQMSEHLHIDYFVCKYFIPVVEFNFYEQLTHHNASLPIQGADVTLLGGGVADFIPTVAIGFEMRPINKVAIRAAVERNMKNHNDIFDNRLTLSAVVSF